MSPESQPPVSEKPTTSSESPAPPETAEERGAEVADAEQGKTPEQQIEFWRSQALAGKGAVEELNRLRREAANVPSHSTVTPPTDPGQTELAELEQLYAAAVAEANQYGNASAKLAAKNLQITFRQAQENWLAQQLLKVPEKHRDQVERGIRERRYADADSALDAIVGREARGELESLRKENERLKGAEAQRAEGVVGTGRGIPVTASQARFIPKALSELNAELARLEQVDPAARAELSRRHRNGDFGILPLQ